MARKSKFEDSFKAKVAMEALKEQKTLAELAKEYDVSPSIITMWKEELLKNAGAAFQTTKMDKREAEKLRHENQKLREKVGQLTIDVNFFAEACEKAGLRKKQ